MTVGSARLVLHKLARVVYGGLNITVKMITKENEYIYIYICM